MSRLARASARAPTSPLSSQCRSTSSPCAAASASIRSSSASISGETYPTAPIGYFGAEATNCLADFRQKAVTNRSEEVMEIFPETFLTKSLQNGWRASAERA